MEKEETKGLSKKEEAIFNYFNFLKDLHYLLSYSNNLSMNKLIKEHKVSLNVNRILLDNKIISNNGKKGISCKWQWISGVKPNMKMAEKLVDELAAYSKRIAERKKQEKEKQIMNQEILVDVDKMQESKAKIENEFNPIELKKVKYHPPKRETVSEVSIFWGMFKLTLRN